jgi:hypothetical protein
MNRCILDLRIGKTYNVFDESLYLLKIMHNLYRIYIYIYIKLFMAHQVSDRL